MNVFESDHEVLQQLANYFKRSRINLQLTQQDIATQAGLDRGVVSRFENGENISLLNFLTLMRSVSKLDRLQELANEERPDPRIVRKTEPQRVRKSKDEPSEGFFME